MNCVKTNGDFICLETASTSYAIRVNGTYAEHVYYGAKIPAEDCAGLVGRRTSLLGDWYEDKSKFPHGLKELSRRLAEKGLVTGQTAACRAAAARARPDAAINSLRI